ncbi:MCE family protein [Gordonia polyisoprenivorans]|uniref:MCE family protein n=1 Tax=Gordonia polyisoprenivorans TaxID=84595 RepID=UPI001AD6DCC8|nr:MlaD family protein [Gordonia polyisoprenivorans]QTI68750.1 MCE family protein [Gordonia polyisoprenivorans]
MKITRFVRIQLIIFAIVTVIAIVAMALFYVRIPAMFGVGRYAVTLQLPNTGGLYENANVAFRGVNVGKVKSVRLTENGVAATLSIDSGTKIPTNSAASVHSVSAVGEQYVEFTPPTGDSSSDYLADGATVSTTDVPVEISSVLDQATALLNRVGDSNLRSLIDEAFDAFNGTAEDLRRLMDSMILLVDDADKNSDVTIDLVKQAGPLMATQSATADQIRAWTADAVKVTDQLRANNPEITDLLQKGPSVASSAQKLFASMDQSLPLLLANLNTVSKTTAVYLPNLQQVLVIYPRLIDTLLTALNAGDPRYGPSVEFSLGFQDPPPCTIGYLPPSQWRSPAVQTARDLPPGMLCRVPQNSQIAVRGARNFPCAEFPGRRAPTPEECRTGYKPISNQVVPFPNGIPGILPAPAGYVTQGTPTEQEDGPAVYGTTYDPESGDFIGPDGRTYNAGTGTGTDNDQQGQGSTWQSLITGAVDAQ